MSHHHSHAHQGGFDENAAERLAWSDAMLLGHGPMDDTHEEFVHVVKALAACNAVTALGCLQAVEDHLLAHFEAEREWMVRTEYPNMDCHLDEHQKVLDTVLRVNQLAKDGQVGLRDVRRLAAALADWFPKHATYLDSALSAWISKRRHGGVPVILRRDLAAGVQQESTFT
ncbi:hemerythrin domain-containing protein [Noviherbaspirillum sp.]|jgi:hemerythrin-like metal-binding protein|uniref:bacteriohemerythrin n=1 Tax=Noviherbaspirillum sp. TaxID=1926288 RepID=UPI0025E56FF9|nr:hemerythrin domain-containing protein [Noviherbaspirillum sp.]